MSDWQGGPNFVWVKRGSNTSRKGGTHSGPNGRLNARFHASNQNVEAQSRQDKKKFEEMMKKDGPGRPIRDPG